MLALLVACGGGETGSGPQAPGDTVVAPPDRPDDDGVTEDPIAVTHVPRSALTAFAPPDRDAYRALRDQDAWIVASPGSIVRAPDRGTPVVLGSMAGVPRLAHAGDDVVLGVADESGTGGRSLRAGRAALEPLDLPYGHVARVGERFFVATGADLTDTSYEVLERGVAEPLVRGGSPERAIGLAVLGDTLIAGVARRDRSLDAPVERRAEAVLEQMRGDPSAAVRLAGPASGYFLRIPLSGGEVVRDEFPEQRPSRMAVLEGDWLVVMSEGTLTHGQRDGFVVARRPGGGWRRLASRIEVPGDAIGAGAWFCFQELLWEGTVVHCISPTRRRHLVTARFDDGASLWDIVRDRDGARLVFTAGLRSHREFLALPLD